MNSVNKTLTMLFVILLLSSLLVFTVSPVNVQAVSKPSVPQFTVKLVDYSYDVSPVTTTTTNEYTGEKTTTTTPGYRVKDIRIEVAIKNQPFTPYTNAEGYTCKLYYNIQCKGCFGEDWRTWITDFEQTDSQYTTLSQINSAKNYAPGDQLDVRVEAITGPKVMSFPDRLLPFQHVEVEASSGWSKVQTFTMPDESSSSPSQTTTPPQNPTTPDNNQPQQPEQAPPTSFVFQPSFLLWIGALLFTGVAIAVVVIYTKKHLKTPN